MMRWFWKRWIWAVVVGTTAISLTVAQQGGMEAPSGPPKVGDVITLKFRDGPDRQVKVVKSDKQPDGSYLSEVKDTKTGETFTLLDRPEESAAPAKPSIPLPNPGGAIPPILPKIPESPKIPEPPKTNEPPPKARPRTNDPLIPPLKDTMPDPAKDKDKEKEKEKSQERQGLLKRFFGKKPPTPSTSTSEKPSTPGATMPIPGRPAPTVTLEPPRTSPVAPVAPPTPIIPRPVRVPTAPSAIKSPSPIVLPTAPIAPALPPIPSVPSVPVTPPSGLPSIPLPPGGVSVLEPLNSSANPTVEPAPPLAPIAPPAAAPVVQAVPAAPATQVPALPPTAAAVVQLPVTRSIELAATPPAVPLPAPQVTVVPVGDTTVQPVAAEAPLATTPTPPAPMVDSTVTAMVQEIQPHITALQSGVTVAQRSLAARALAGGRHGSSDTVKMILCKAAMNDTSPAVRIVCIQELCKLGCYDAEFSLCLTKACEDPSEALRKVAKDALNRMTPRR